MKLKVKLKPDVCKKEKKKIKVTRFINKVQ